MKTVLWFPAACALALALSSCGPSGRSGGGHSQASVGPFDSRGNYVEDWADNPAKWPRSGNAPSPHEMKSDVLPEIAKNDQPPQNSNPLPPANVSKPTPVISQTQVAKPKTAPKKSSQAVVKTRQSAQKSEPVLVKAKTQTTKTKPKSQVAKTKTKPKSTRYVVKKGDSLSAIASRNGTSVSAIRSENRISGNLIHPGQSLVIPKR